MIAFSAYPLRVSVSSINMRTDSGMRYKAYLVMKGSFLDKRVSLEFVGGNDSLGTAELEAVMAGE